MIVHVHWHGPRGALDFQAVPHFRNDACSRAPQIVRASVHNWVRMPVYDLTRQYVRRDRRPRAPTVAPPPPRL